MFYTDHSVGLLTCYCRLTTGIEVFSWTDNEAEMWADCCPLPKMEGEKTVENDALSNVLFLSNNKVQY